MKTIKEEVINEITINKSRFITILININNINEVNTKINEYKKRYKDATHYCTAYIINGYEKCDDDKEPSGTAGMPILNVLKKQNLTNVLCLVIRYFGGIKLGASGLTRAYAKSASEAIKKGSIVNLVSGYQVTIELVYENIKDIDYLLKNLKINKTFSDKIIYEFLIKEKDFLKIENLLKQKSQIIKKENILLAI